MEAEQDSYERVTMEARQYESSNSVEGRRGMKVDEVICLTLVAEWPGPMSACHDCCAVLSAVCSMLCCAVCRGIGTPMRSGGQLCCCRTGVSRARWAVARSTAVGGAAKRSV